MTQPNEFKALVITEGQDKQFLRAVETKTIDDLPEGDVVVKVVYSSLNYKDGLSALFDQGGSLVEAQERKYQRMLEQIELRDGELRDARDAAEAGSRSSSPPTRRRIVVRSFITASLPRCHGWRRRGRAFSASLPWPRPARSLRWSISTPTAAP